MRSRTTFATIEAAAIEAILASPWTMRLDRTGQARRVVAVDEGEVGPAGQRRERLRHRRKRGLADVDRVDRRMGDRREADRGGGEDLGEKLLPAGLRQDLRIGEAGGHPPEVEHDRRRDDRPGERPAADLVEPGDAGVPGAGEPALEGRFRPGRPAASRGRIGAFTRQGEQVLGPLSPS